MINNYFFDFDKTLASSGNASVSATKEAYKSMGLTVPNTNSILSYMGIPAEISFKKMAVEKLDSKQILQLTDKFRSIYQDVELQSTKLYPGILEMLQQLSHEKKNLFIVSSKKTDAVKRNLKNLKIIGFFNAVVGFDMVKNYKPAPDGILLLIDIYHLNKVESIMVGDAKYDIQMGHAAGVKTCGALWDAFDVQGLTKAHPTYLIDQPKQLLKLE
ncbi:HAD family hydrolase [Lentilactobacillus sunkii]|uniref:Phosphoglycolate phosphatase, bacterial n=1 Tax=Lentilactobacillus sunkii DSM 19904 TaxID=1423808 RepID=A0A0R1KSP7_9LACO|nr:HAD-IA family hydrolase [Lentilactobacillus sunkii]KRK86621.1 phosphoglycolate phosphatase, bacterial [Lentilactobacillus sunkii DSM 19904]